MPYIETSQLICSANHLTGFYVMATLVFNELIISQKLSLDKRPHEIRQGFVIDHIFWIRIKLYWKVLARGAPCRSDIAIA